MTANIKSLIEQISEKSRSLHHLLVIERERASSFEVEINRLRDENSALLDKQEVLSQEVHSLKTEISQQNSMNNEVADVKSNDLRIDSLVREIDFCIQQLKIANE